MQKIELFDTPDYILEILNQNRKILELNEYVLKLWAGGWSHYDQL